MLSLVSHPINPHAMSLWASSQHSSRGDGNGSGSDRSSDDLLPPPSPGMPRIRPSRIAMRRARALSSGTYGDVFTTVMHCGKGKTPVVVKRPVRGCEEDQLNEIWAYAQVGKSPNVLPVLGTCLCRDTHVPLLVMPVMQGTLRDYMRRVEAGGRPMAVAEAATIGLSVVNALHHLHGAGLVHGDVKDNNVFTDGKRWYLGDLGMAVDAYSDVPLEFSSQRLYFPPEGVVGTFTDVYAFGALVVSMAHAASGTSAHLRQLQMFCYANFATLADAMDVVGSQLSARVTHEWLPLLALAYRCLNHVYTQRPSTAEVMRELEEIKLEKAV